MQRITTNATNLVTLSTESSRSVVKLVIPLAMFVACGRLILGSTVAPMPGQPDQIQYCACNGTRDMCSTLKQVRAAECRAQGLRQTPTLAGRAVAHVCEIRLSDCAAQPQIPTGKWIDDAEYGGRMIHSEEKCLLRKTSWLHDCGSTRSSSVEVRYRMVCNTIESLAAAMSCTGPFLLVVTAHLFGGSNDFLNMILPPHAVLVKPTDPVTDFSSSAFLHHTMMQITRDGAKLGCLPGKDLLEALVHPLVHFDKVFINHPLVPIPFLRGLFALGKRYISLTHDFMWILKTPQPTFHQLRAPGGADRNYHLHPFISQIEMNSQHTSTASIFRMMTPSFRSLTVLQMPDYNESLSPALPADPDLKVGVIGAISNIKGSHLVEQLSHLTDVFVFGIIDIQRENNGVPSRLRSEAYSTIAQLNRLLRRERPNVLIVPALWPETYSYTLTLSMLTHLPIIVLKRPETYEDCAVIARARAYPLAHFHDFSSMASVVELAAAIKGTTLRLVKPKLHVPPQWEILLRPTLCNIVLVASKIVTSNRPLSYFPSRSRFTPEQRFKHTLETFASIRQFIPMSFIVFIDNSNLKNTSWAEELRRKSDIFVNDWSNQSLRYYTDISDHKGLGEALLLDQGLQHLESMKVMATSIFKLTGRYTLAPTFDIRQYENTHNVFKKAEVGLAAKLKPTYTYTCFYKIHHTHLTAYRASLLETISTLQRMTDRNIPTALYDDVESRLAPSLPDVQLVKTLGVMQRVSPFAVEDEYI